MGIAAYHMAIWRMRLPHLAASLDHSRLAASGTAHISCAAQIAPQHRGVAWWRNGEKRQSNNLKTASMKK